MLKTFRLCCCCKKYNLSCSVIKSIYQICWWYSVKLTYMWPLQTKLLKIEIDTFTA